MAYYPLSQIKTNLYTNGTEFTTLDGVVYTGYYFKTSTGQLFTGRTPQDLPNQELIVFNINSFISEGTALSTPAFYTSDPDPDVSEEYREFTEIYNEYLLIKEEFRRYFCKKTNEILYLEINKATYDKLIVKDIQYLYSLYEPFNLPWKLTGTKEEVEKINRNIVELTSKRLQLPQLGRYLKDDYLSNHDEDYCLFSEQSLQ